MTTDRPGGRRWPRLLGTVRFRTTAIATAATFMVLVVAGIALVFIQRGALIESVDETNEAQAAEVVSTLKAGGDPASVSIGDDSFVRVVAPDGTELLSAGEAGADDARTTTQAVTTAEGDIVVEVGTSLEDVQEATAALSVGLAVLIPAVAAILAAVVWWLTGRTLRPVESIRAHVADIEAHELDRRVPQPDTGDEIADLAATMNAMLDRVEAATERQRRFVADASHELRSPLARIRSEIEVDIAHPDDADPAATHASILHETTELSHLVDDLLHLARSDAQIGRPDVAPEVDLDDIVFREAERLRADGRVRVDVSHVSAAQVPGDERQLTRALRNIADNAAQYGAATVRFDLGEVAGEALLVIADDGPGIPDFERERVFERFARVDDARARETGGTGLGLAITKDIVLAHGGSIQIDPDYRAGTRFVITLPATAPN